VACSRDSGRAGSQLTENQSRSSLRERADAKELKATPLDFNGYPGAETIASLELRLRPNVVYYLIRP
jgi:hypothetical protein